jgi:hypothetical protein
MAVGEKYPFLQFGNSTRQTLDTAGATVTFSTGAQPDPEVRIQNLSTATAWIGMGLQSTSSAAVTTQGMMIPPATQAHSVQIFRAGGNLKVAAFTVGATQTAIILVTGGEGVM